MFISTHVVTTQKGTRGKLSRAFAFVFSWYKVIVALSLCLSWGVIQHTVRTSIIAAKIVSLYYFFEPQYFGPDLRLARTKTAVSIRSIQNADCRPGTKCRLSKKCRLRIYTFFFVWYVMACYLTTYRASRNRFSAIIFHDYLHYNCTVARFLITIILHIISHSILTLRASWLVWCLYRIYQLNKRRCRCKWDASIEYLTRAIFEKQVTALHVVQMFHLFNRYVFILLKKMRTETKTVPSTWYSFNVQRCTHTDFVICVLYYYLLSCGTSEFL